MNKDLEAGINPVRGIVASISKMVPVGAQFYTVEADFPKGAKEFFDKTKAIIASDPTSPDVVFNRPPRVVKLRTNDVLSQEFAVDPYGNKMIVFNAGTDSEASAAIATGSPSDIKFGQATDEALKDALQGQSRIFADGMKTLTKVNTINNAELSRWMGIRDIVNGYIDSIKNTIESNVKKVNDYNKVMADTTPEVDITSTTGPVAVVIK